MRLLSPRTHGVLDYLLGAIFLVAPLVLDFKSLVAQLASFVVGGALLLMSLLTRYPLGVLRVIPFPVHGGIELVSGLALLALPWIGGFDQVLPTRNFFLGTGIVVVGLWLTTDYKAAEATRPGLFPRGARSGA